VTFDAIDGDFDEWDLAWTSNGTGTFVRREYKDHALDDTDTGSFQENSGEPSPPANLIGIRLEETIQLEDERFEFLTDTAGREFEPGDVDPFTYVYTVTGATTANVIATFKSDKWDDLALTFESESRGTYLLQRYDDNVLKDEKRGDFFTNQNTHTVDLTVGESIRSLVGDDFYNASGARQTAKIKIRKNKGTTRFLTYAENDGDDDSLNVRSSRGNRNFAVQIFSNNPRRNVTSKISRGRGLTIEDVPHAVRKKFVIQTKTKRSRGRLTLRFRGSSNSIRGAVDQAKVKLLKR